MGRVPAIETEGFLAEHVNIYIYISEIYNALVFLTIAEGKGRIQPCEAYALYFRSASYL